MLDAAERQRILPLIQRYGLRTGDEIAGEAGPSPGKGKNAPLVNLLLVNGSPPDTLGRRPDFARKVAEALHEAWRAFEQPQK